MIMYQHMYVLIDGRIRQGHCVLVFVLYRNSIMRHIIAIIILWNPDWMFKLIVGVRSVSLFYCASYCSSSYYWKPEPPGGMFSIPSECTSLQNASVHVRNMNIWQDICQGRAKGLGLGRGTPLHTPPPSVPGDAPELYTPKASCSVSFIWHRRYIYIYSIHTWKNISKTTANFSFYVVFCHLASFFVP